MFPVTITLHNAQQLAAVTLALTAEAADKAIESIQTKKESAAKPEATEKKPTSARTTEKPAHTPRTAEAGADAAPESKAENSGEAQSGNSGAQPDRATVADAIKRLAPKNRDALVEILAKHGGKHLNDIAAENWAALLADLEKALA